MAPRSVVALTAILLFASSISDAQTPKRGGVLRIGNLGEPPSLDPHWGTQTITEVLTNHIFEGLYSLDDSYRPIPMLADGMPSVSPDGLTYTIKLRRGVKFHNGKEMTSDDVVASLARWGKRAVYGKSLFAQVADFKATDRYAVEFRLKEKSAIVAISLAVPNNFGAIYPKEIAEKFPPDQRITEWVGTGPFKLAEWKPDQYIRMVRFDDYKALAGRPSGYGGAKVAYVDELRWIPVPDAASRAAQIESGDLDVADDLVADAYDRLKANGHRQAVLLARRSLQQEGRPHDEREAAAGLAGRARHRADHEDGGGRKARVLSHGLEPRVPRASHVAHEDRGPALERAQPG
jgi:peptide/nickel transport system substrate-binding protein